MTFHVRETHTLLLLLLSRFSRVRLCATPETAAHQAPPSMGFARQEYWSGLPLHTYLLNCSGVKDYCLPKRGELFLSYGLGVNFKIPFALSFLFFFYSVFYSFGRQRRMKLLEETFKNPTLGNWWITALEIPTKVIC